MREIAIGLLCLLGGIVGVAPAEEPKRLSAQEVEKELGIAEAYLNRDRDKPPADAKAGETTVAKFAATSVVQNIGGLPEESAVRLKAIALARKYSAIPEYAAEAILRKQKRPDGVDDHQAHTRLYFAWGVLRETGVLRDGMRLEDLVALLGPPTRITPETAEWHNSSQIHVNPCLYYWRQDYESGKKKKGQVEVTRK